MDKYDKILEVLENLSERDLIDVWNGYCDNNSYYDSKIYYMSELDDVYGYNVFNGMPVSEVAETIRRDFEDFDFDDRYFYVTVFGFESCNSIDDFANFDIDDLCTYVVDYDEAFGVTELRDALEEIAEDDEDEE